MRPLALAYHAIGTRAVREDPHGLFVSWARLRRHTAWLQRRGILAGDVRRAGRARRGRAVRADLRRRVRELLGAGGPRRSGDAVRHHGLAGRPASRVAAPRCSPRTGCGGCTRQGSRSGRTPRPIPTSRRSASTRRATSSPRAPHPGVAELRTPVTSTAYPYGRATAETVRGMRTAGFAAACRTSGFGSRSTRSTTPRGHGRPGPRCSGCGSRRRGATSRSCDAPRRAARGRPRSGRVR